MTSLRAEQSIYDVPCTGQKYNKFGNNAAFISNKSINGWKADILTHRIL